jgi:hypothetical protein
MEKTSFGGLVGETSGDALNPGRYLYQMEEGIVGKKPWVS